MSERNKKLEQLERRLYSQTPLIRGILRRRAVKALTWDGSPEALRMLGEAVIRSHDEYISKLVIESLQYIAEQGCREAQKILGGLIIEHHHPQIDQILRPRVFERFAWDGSPEIVRILVDIVTSSHDEQIVEDARQAFWHLTHQNGVNEVCAVWENTRHPKLANIIIEHGWVATMPVTVKVLSALKTGKLETVTGDGVDVIEPLLQAYGDEDREIRHNATKCLRSLKNPDAIDALCARWAAKREFLTTQAIVQAGYVARQPIPIRVLTELLLGREVSEIGGGPQIIEALLQACEDSDPVIAKHARLTLKQLKDPETQEAFCERVIEHEQPLMIQEIVRTLPYAPRDPARQALFYFLSEQWEKYSQLDFDQNLLKTVYPLLEPDIQKRLAACARRAGRLEWVQVIAGERQKKHLEKMTEDEWESILTILRVRQAWTEMWRLVQGAPMRWSALLLQQLSETTWRPELAEEHSAFVILTELAKHCQGEEIPRLEEEDQCFASVKGHISGIFSVSISPNGRSLASGSMDGSVRLWNILDGTALRTRRKQPKEWRVSRLAISSDWRLLASGGRSVRLWSLPDGVLLKTLMDFRDQEFATCVAISPDGKWLAIGSILNLSSGLCGVRLCHLPDAEVSQTLEGQDSCINDLAISPGGRLLASGSEDSIIRLWQLPDGTLMKMLKGHTEGVTCVAISPDGRLLASGSGDTTIRLWRLPDGKMLQMLKGHTEGVWCVAISPDGRLLASGSGDSTIRLWRLPDGAALTTLEGHTEGVTCVAISLDGRLLASGCKDGTVGLWKVWKMFLHRLLAGKVIVEEVQFIENFLQQEPVIDHEQKWMKFALALMRWQRRFDIEVDDVSTNIPRGEFDIEIGT